MTTIQKNYSLKAYNSFGMDVKTKGFAQLTDTAVLPELIRANPFENLLILGGGSNILFTRDFDGLILHLANKGIQIIWETDQKIGLEIQAGENWHTLVLWCLKHQYGGIENLALIPGKVGAAPIQNIGAYGVEFESVFHSCTVLDVDSLQTKELSKEDCKLSYRNSIFKNEAKGKYIILSVQIALHKSPHPLHLEYGALKNQITTANPTIEDVAQAVMAIRKAKLPDPEILGNGGSFFKNPVVTENHFTTLLKEYPNLPHFDHPDGYKLPAAWLIDKLGFKGYRKGPVGVHEKQALVLVHYGGGTGAKLVTLAQTIEDKVLNTFGIRLEREVNVL